MSWNIRRFKNSRKSNSYESAKESKNFSYSDVSNKTNSTHRRDVKSRIREDLLGRLRQRSSQGRIDQKLNRVDVTSPRDEKRTELEEAVEFLLVPPAIRVGDRVWVAGGGHTYHLSFTSNNVNQMLNDCYPRPHTSYQRSMRHKVTDSVCRRNQQNSNSKHKASSDNTGFQRGVGGTFHNSDTASFDRKNNECVICMENVRDATIVHGDTGHIVCCSKCAFDLKKNNMPCPMCRQNIHLVVKNYY